MNDDELAKIQEQRDTQFAKVCDEMGKTFREKNLQYRDAFMQVNEDLDEAFEDVRRKVDQLNVQLKYRDRTFRREKFLQDLRDLGVYTVMMVLFVEGNNPGAE